MQALFLIVVLLVLLYCGSSQFSHPEEYPSELVTHYVMMQIKLAD